MEQEVTEQHVCEKCGNSADNFIQSKKQWFCLDCLLGWPNGTIDGWVAENQTASQQ